MIALILTSLMLPAKEIVQEAFKPLLEKSGFTATYDHSSPRVGGYLFGYKRADDQQTLEIRTSFALTQSSVEQTRIGLGSAADTPDREKAPSNIQLGDYSFLPLGGQCLYCGGDGFLISIREPHGATEVANESDIRGVEALGRVGLAECIGSVLHNDGSAMSHVGSAIEHTHKTYVPLPEIAKRNTIKTTLGEWFDRCTVTYKNHKLEFALGSDWVSMDGRILTLEAFVARKNGVWMIPIAVLRRNGFASF